MALALLNCSICPKRPIFSDTSHLLTHVGSKGHLAHLHKLQVRSHQEITAGHQLAVYNQWYQQHGLGQLLSERMQQKDSKTALKRERALQNTDTMKKEEIVAYGDAANFALVSPSQVKVNTARPRRRHIPVSRCVKRQSAPESDSEYESSPIKRNRRRKGRMLYSTPAKGLTSDNVFNSSGADCPAEDDPQFPTPENAKLKGVIWPGMDLFDAATTEMRRKRNQKKDGSVLKNMERTSAMIEPTEVVYSPGGTMRKQRYIDGMVDESSPLRGETPVPRSPPRRKRQPLATASSNMPRLAKRSAKATKPSMSKVFRDPTPTAMSHLHYVPSSSTNASFGTASRFSPTEDENMEFKLTIGSLPSRKRTGNFTVFNDNTARYQPAMLPPVKTGEGLQHPRFTYGPVHNVPPRPQLSFLTAPWLQPHYQLPMYYNNGYMAYNRSQAPLKSYQETGPGKENVEWTTTDAKYAAESLTANPLGYPFSGSDMNNGLAHHMSPVHPPPSAFSDAISQFDDPFAYDRNPLSAAFGQFDGPLMSSSEEVKQRVLSPDGTISDIGEAGR